VRFSLRCDIIISLWQKEHQSKRKHLAHARPQNVLSQSAQDWQSVADINFSVRQRKHASLAAFSLPTRDFVSKIYSY
jgi:hypothetical protein